MRTFRLRTDFRRQIVRVCFLISCAGALGIFSARADDLAGRVKKNYQEARARFMAQTNDAEAAWQFARACFDCADGAANNADRARFASEGIAAAQQSLAEKDTSAAAHYYLGMNLGQLADTKHNLSGLHLVKDMEREFNAARLLDEHFDEAGPDRNLGLLYEQTPVLISIGSRSKARAHLEKAVELTPNFPENRLNLIEAYLKWGYRSEALDDFTTLEKIWPEARKKFAGEAWESSWQDWEKRLNAARRKLNLPKANERPHSTP